jgi:hypothetical protein
MLSNRNTNGSQLSFNGLQDATSSGTGRKPPDWPETSASILLPWLALVL